MDWAGREPGRAMGRAMGRVSRGPTGRSGVDLGLEPPLRMGCLGTGGRLDPTIAPREDPSKDPGKG